MALIYIFFSFLGIKNRQVEEPHSFSFHKRRKKKKIKKQKKQRGDKRGLWTEPKMLDVESVTYVTFYS